MKNPFFLFFLSLAIILLHFGCKQDSNDSKSSIELDNFILSKLKSPVGSGGEPNLFVSEQGKIYLSWVEYLNDTTDALMFSKMENEIWTTPTEIARGSDWFVNWADFPSLVVYKNNDQHMAAHWLQKRAAGTYDYDVHIAQSKDGGKTWGKSFIIHTDRVAAEHGFVTMLPQDDGKIFATWLDGRFTKIEGEKTTHNDHGHGGSGAMTLRTATFDIEGKLYDEKELDHQICDCCQTAAIVTPEKTLIAYRDRSVDEIRDISFVQKVNNSWASPSLVHADNWKIVGCPVNGPALANYKNDIAIAWFTNADEKSKVNISFYNNETTNFEKPIRIDEGNPLGRVGIELFENFAIVSWLEQVGENAEIKLAQISPNPEEIKKITLAKSSTSRRSGFPQIEKTEDKIIFAWTVSDGKKSTIETAFWKYK
ncbi:MAG: sialidase family protein [Saprospiraceae bacterium]